MIPIHKSGGGVAFAVRIHPRARRNAITGELDHVLRVSLTAAPIDGRANTACIEFFAKLLKLPRSSVTIAFSETSRQKIIRVPGLSAQELRRRLGLQLTDS